MNTDVSDLVLGSDDTVLTQFAELHVVVVLEGVTAQQHPVTHQPPPLLIRTEHIIIIEHAPTLPAALSPGGEDTIHAPESRQWNTPGRRGQQQLSILKNKQSTLIAGLTRVLIPTPLSPGVFNTVSTGAVPAVFNTDSPDSTRLIYSPGSSCV